MITVAGPERSGSGRGVPVPNMTICVVDIDGLFSEARIAPSAKEQSEPLANSLRSNVRGLDDVSPTRGRGLQPSSRFLTGAGDRFQFLGAQSRLDGGARR